MKKNVLKALVLLQILFFSAESTLGQMQGAISIGAMQYEGDIGGRFPKGPRQLNNPTSKPAIAVGMELGYKIAPFLVLRTGLSFGTIYGDDTKISPKNFDTIDSLKAKRNFDRALQFKSPINEITIGAELYPLYLLNSSLETALQPYIVLGFGVFSFNPKGIWTDTSTKINSWVDLRPLRTEGQGIYKDITNQSMGFINDEYKLTTTNLSIGFGLKYAIRNNLHIGYELFIRRTSTDYLDDASKDYIDINVYNDLFATNNTLKDQARQLSNRGQYYKDDTRFIGDPQNFAIGNTRGGREEIINDFYYTNSIKLIFEIGGENNSFTSRKGFRRYTRCPPVF
jgi:hypothetical protein